MPSPSWAIGFLLLTASAVSAADTQDPLVRARLLYNQRQFDAAIAAAEGARRVIARADSADLIAARAFLERFREGAALDDLTSARERLRRINPARFGLRERTEFIVGLGETLFFDESAGAAAAMFASALARREDLAPEARERVLDWWASALDREARPRPDLERQIVYQNIRDRMEAELDANPSSTVAAYWLSAAAWSQGDLQSAWHLAQAGWVRAPLATDGGTVLREDLDRLVQRGIVPARARTLAQPPENLRLEWERFKEKWSR